LFKLEWKIIIFFIFLLWETLYYSNTGHIYFGHSIEDKNHISKSAPKS